MFENRNEIEIHATPEQIWKTLIEIENYAEWNPLLYRGEGKVEVGETVKVSAKTASKKMDFVCEVVKVEPFSEFAWVFHVIHPILFRGKHIFRLEPVSESTVKFIDREIFSGLLGPTQSKDIKTNGLNGMIAMGNALKAQCELSKAGVAVASGLS